MVLEVIDCYAPYDNMSCEICEKIFGFLISYTNNGLEDANIQGTNVFTKMCMENILQITSFYFVGFFSWFPIKKQSKCKVFTYNSFCKFPQMYCN